MIKIEAAARLQTKVTAAYTGTKSTDLVPYIRSLVPSVKLRKLSGMAGGPATRDPSVWTGRISIADAHALGNKLLADGWVGRKRKFKRRGTDTVVQYVLYIPANSEEFKFTPDITLYKPAKGENLVRITVSHPTNASHRERDTLNFLNRFKRMPRKGELYR